MISDKQCNVYSWPFNFIDRRTASSEGLIRMVNIRTAMVTVTGYVLHKVVLGVTKSGQSPKMDGKLNLRAETR